MASLSSPSEQPGPGQCLYDLLWLVRPKIANPPPPLPLGSAQDGLMSLVSLVAKVLEQPMPPTIEGPVEEGPTHRIYGVPFAMLAARPTDSLLRLRARIDGGAERGSFSYACNHLTVNRRREEEGPTRAV